MKLSKEERLIKLKANVSNCRKFVSLFKCYDDKTVLINFLRCKSPFCSYCSKLKRKELFLKLKHKNLYNFRFLTLTLKKTDDLENDYKRLNKSFTRLISKLKRSFLPRHKFEYIKVVELGKNNNLHLHVLCNFFIDVRKLSALWQDITKDSFIVYASKVKAKNDIIRYVLKYFSKSLDDSSEFFALKRRWSHSDLFFEKLEKIKKKDWLLIDRNILISDLWHTLRFFLSNAEGDWNFLFGFVQTDFPLLEPDDPPPLDPYSNEHHPGLDQVWKITHQLGFRPREASVSI